MSAPLEHVPFEGDPLFDAVVVAERTLEESTAIKAIDSKIMATTGNLLYFSETMTIRDHALIRFAHDQVPIDTKAGYLPPHETLNELVEQLEINQTHKADEALYALLECLTNRELMALRDVYEHHQAIAGAFHETVKQFFADNSRRSNHVQDRVAFITDLFLIAEKSEETTALQLPQYDSGFDIAYDPANLYISLKSTYDGYADSEKTMQDSEKTMQGKYVKRFTDVFTLRPLLDAAVHHRFNLQD